STNVIGPVLLTQAFAPLLQKSRHAKVLNITSELSSIAQTDTFGTPSYAISKAALNMATRQLSAALAPRVTVFCAHPGWVKTDMGGAGAELTPKTSVAGLLKVLDAITPKDAGTYVDYRGKTLPW